MAYNGQGEGEEETGSQEQEGSGDGEKAKRRVVEEGRGEGIRKIDNTELQVMSS